MRTGAAKLADRCRRTPYGRQRSASAAAFARYSGVRLSGLALTLLTTDPLMPIEAFARA
jgi:hypothetical protein